MVKIMTRISEHIADMSRHAKYPQFTMADLIQMGANVATGRETQPVISL